MLRAVALATVLAPSAVVSAAPTLSSDSFSSYADVQLRSSPDKVKDFAKQWVKVVGTESPETTTEYLLKGAPPAFEGIKVDKAVASVSKHLHVVIGIGLSFSAGCAQLAKALKRTWGEPFDVGGRNHELEWKGKRVDASVTDDGPGCMLFIADLGYDDEKDDWKKPR